MEGLEVSEVYFKEAIKDAVRFDSEYYLKEYNFLFNSNLIIKPLSCFVEEGYRVVYENTKIIDKEIAIKNNYPCFLQATDLDTPFINTDNLYFVDNEEWVRYPKGRVKKGEILIEVKGKIDKVAIVPYDFPEKTLVSGSLFKLSVNDKINKHFLLVYLVSKYGTMFKNRFKTNLLISYVSKPDLYKIPVPLFSNIYQDKIANMFNDIFIKQKQSQTLYTQAENLLLDSLGLKDFEPTNKGTNIKTLKSSFLQSGRLDAEYYQPKYDEIEKAIKNYEGGYTYIKDVFKQEKNIREQGKYEYHYTEIGDVNISNGSVSYSKVLEDELPANGKMRLSKGNIIISKVRPYRGAIGIIREEPKNYVGSGAFTILSEKSSYKKEVLQVLLRCNHYKDLIMKYNAGTSYPVVKDDDLLNLPIPIIDYKIQQEISGLIEKSFALKQQSEQLLETAKRSVEIAIEQNEEAAMEYIMVNC